MTVSFPRTRIEYTRASWHARLVWGIRPNALRHARDAGVDADIEASIRNYAQISRTIFYALLFTALLTLIVDQCTVTLVGVARRAHALFDAD